MKRIAVLNTHPIQYFAPLYAYLNAQPDFGITAIYLSDFSLRGAHDQGFGQTVQWDLELLSGYRNIFVGRAAHALEPDRGFWSIATPQVWSAVRNGGFDALWLHGHAYAANLIALAAARSVGMPVLMRCETHLGLPRGGMKRALRGPLLRALYSQCDRFLAIGSMNRDFYLAMGCDPRRIFSVPYSVDNDRFIRSAAMTAQERAEARRTLGVFDNRPIVLYASKFQQRKHPDDLVRACRRLSQEGVSFHLVMVGSGEMDSNLRALVEELAMPDAHFVGFVNQSALPKVYAACDVFVLPSEAEPWGLVVNEAMCAGLPIVAARGVGSAADLVLPGENGAIFDARDIDGLAACLRPILQDDVLRRRMSAQSLDVISRWGYAECAAGLRAALAGVGPKRPLLSDGL